MNETKNSRSRPEGGKFASTQQSVLIFSNFRLTNCVSPQQSIFSSSLFNISHHSLSKMCCCFINFKLHFTAFVHKTNNDECKRRQRCCWTLIMMKTAVSLLCTVAELKCAQANGGESARRCVSGWVEAYARQLFPVLYWSLTCNRNN